MRLCASRYVVSWRATIFSTIFETNDTRHVRNWPVVVWISRIQPLALEDRNQDGSLLGRRQSSLTDGVVADDGEEWEKDIDKLLQQGCRKRVKLAGFRSRGENEPRRLVAVTGARVDKPKDVGGKTGGGELAVSFRTSSTLVVNADK